MQPSGSPLDSAQQISLTPHFNKRRLLIVLTLLVICITLFVFSLLIFSPKKSVIKSISVSTIGSLNQAVTPASSWKEYSIATKPTNNPQYPWAGFILSYPANWKLDADETGSAYILREGNDTYMTIHRPYDLQETVYSSCSFVDIHPPDIPNEFVDYVERVYTNIPTTISADRKEKWRIGQVNYNSKDLHKVCAYSPELRLYTEVTALGKIEFINFAHNATATAEFQQIIKKIRFAP